MGSRKIFSSPQHEHKNRLNSSSNNSFGSSDSSNGVANINPFKSRASTSAYEKGTTICELGDHGKQQSLPTNLLSDTNINQNCDDDEMENQGDELLRMQSY